MKIRSLLTGLIAAAAMAACVHQMPPAKNFTQELSNQYHHLFIGDRADQRWINQQYFAGKGDQVAKGRKCAAGKSG